MTNPPRSILLMRHAKSSWGDAGLPDHDRPLNQRGQAAAPTMGKLLQKQGLLPDIIYTSTALRARETTEAFVEASDFRGPVVVVPRLYLAEPATYFDLFTEVPDGVRRPMFVAHNPGIADLVEVLSGRFQEMCTAGVAHIGVGVAEISQIDKSTRGEFLGFLRPPRD